MPNVAQVLKAEISRIGRKEAKSAVMPIHRRTIQLERSAADLKRRVAALEKLNRELQSRLGRVEPVVTAATATAEPGRRNWISGKGVKSLRRSLSISQAELARLVDVSDQSIYNWESQKGKLNLRDATRARLMSLRGIGAREAKRRLAGLTTAKTPARKK